MFGRRLTINGTRILSQIWGSTRQWQGAFKSGGNRYLVRECPSSSGCNVIRKYMAVLEMGGKYFFMLPPNNIIYQKCQQSSCAGNSLNKRQRFMPIFESINLVFHHCVWKLSIPHIEDEDYKSFGPFYTLAQLDLFYLLRKFVLMRQPNI